MHASSPAVGSHHIAACHRDLATSWSTSAAGCCVGVPSRTASCRNRGVLAGVFQAPRDASLEPRRSRQADIQ